MTDAVNVVSNFASSIIRACFAFRISSLIFRPMDFAQFEHDGWERVAAKYDSVWSSSTRQFISPLLDAADVAANMLLLDVGCGPGYVSAAALERGAKPVGLDFSKEMIGIARRMFPQIEFQNGNALNLPFGDAIFDRVVANFALLHVPDPERASAEACRVLKRGGKFAFTIWAPAAESPYAQIIDDAIETYGRTDVPLPQGPPHHLYADREGFRQALERAGFDGKSLLFKPHTIEWHIPTPRFVFDAERHAGVRTAGLLALQTPEALTAIQSAIETAVRAFAKGDGFSIPKAAYIVAVSKP